MSEPSPSVLAPHPLDNPVWGALTTRQSSFAEGGPQARRYPVAVAPFAATLDHSVASFEALHALMSPTDRVALVTQGQLPPPTIFDVVTERRIEQLTGAASGESSAVPRLVTLGVEDVPEMLALVALTKPGPFSLRTHELGLFLGVRAGSQLVAMAGERMKLEGYTEITGVCTHPSHRGHGYAQALLAAMSSRIMARGETPFLHVFSDNASAIALYRRLGMTVRRQMYVTILGQRT